MGLQEVNRARIEQLKTDFENLEEEMFIIRDDVESIDPIVNDNSFPNIVPKIPVSVTASPLFRSIQVMWAYDTATYIAAFEVYASKENGFTPLATHLVWSGKAGAFNHEASTGETWHFRVRAVNTHGVASDYSEQVSASTIDISGFEIDEQWQIDLIEYTEQYTDERKTEIMQAVADKADYEYVYNNLLLKADAESVNQAIARINADVASKASTDLLEALEADVLTKVDAEWVNGQLVSKADTTTVEAALLKKAELEWVEGQLTAKADNSRVTTLSGTVDSLSTASGELRARIIENEEALSSQGGSLTTITQEVDEIAGTLATTVTTLSSLGGTVSGQSTAIMQNSEDIMLKANQTTVDTLTGDITDINTELGVQAGLIALKAEQSSLEATDGNVTKVVSDVGSLTVTVGGIVSDVSSLSSTVDSHGTTISETSATVTQLADDITSKVDNLTYTTDQDGVISRLDSHNTLISQNATAITSKVASTTYNAKMTALDGSLSSLGGRLSTAETTLTQHDDAISLRAVKTDVYTKAEINTSLAGKASNGVVSDINERVETAEAELLVQADAITSKVSNTKYNTDQAGVISSLDSHNSRITQNATNITSKVSQTAYDAKVLELGNGITGIDSRLKTAETTISQQNNAIALRALATDVYKRTEVDTKLGGKANTSAVTAIDTRVKSAEAELLIQADAITSKVEQTTYNQAINGIISDVSSHNTRITQNATAITQRVTNTTFNALAGRVGTAESTITQQAGQIALRVTQEEYDADINDSANGLIARMTKNEASITTLSDSIELMATKSSVDTRIGDVVHDLSLQDGRIKVNATAIAQRVTTTTYNALAGRVSSAEGSITTMAGQVALKASQSDLNAVGGRLSTAEATLKVLPGQISTKVEKNGVISSINQSAEEIKINVAKLTLNGDLEVVGGLTKLKNLIVDSVHIKNGAIIERMVSANVIANVINAGTANIDFAKIGNVTITNAMVSSLSASKLTSGTIKGVTINGSTFDSRLNAYNYTTIKDNHFHSEGQFTDTKHNFGASFGEFDIHDGNMYFRVGSRSGNTKGVSTVFDFTRFGLAVEGPYGQSTYLSDGVISFGDWVDGAPSSSLMELNDNLHIFAKDRVMLDGNIEVIGKLIVSSGVSNGIESSGYLPIRAGGWADILSNYGLRLRTTSGGNATIEAGTAKFDGFISHAGAIDAEYGGGVHAYIRTKAGGETRATQLGTTGTYQPFRAASFPTSSSIMYKDNREMFSEYDAYFVLDNVDIWKYHLNVNVDNRIYDKPKVGMMTEMVPQLLRDEDGVDPYSITSLLFKVAQLERQKRVALEKRVEDLEELLGVIVAS